MSPLNDTMKEKQMDESDITYQPTNRELTYYNYGLYKGRHDERFRILQIIANRTEHLDCECGSTAGVNVEHLLDEINFNECPADD